MPTKLTERQSANHSRLPSYLSHAAWVELLSKTYVITSSKVCSFGYTDPNRCAEKKLQALHRSKSACQRTRLIIFLGTPHRGSPSADWAQIASNMASLALQDSNKKILKTLEINNEVLDNIQEAFLSIVHEDDLIIHSFQEARGISGIKGLNNEVQLFQVAQSSILTCPVNM